MKLRPPRLLPLLALVAACQDPAPDDSGKPGDTDPGEVLHLDVEEGCDPLVPEYCGYPFPSDFLLAADGGTPTGFHLALTPQMVPESPSGESFEEEPWLRLDGVSPSTEILALFPSLPDLSAAPSQWDIEASLAATSPTVVLDLETGERIPHWVELDARTEDEGQRSLYVRLARRLEEDRSYAVAFLDLVDVGGAALPPSEAFRALRDDLRTDAPALEARRASYETMFEALEAAGVERSSLTLAWWFHTASADSIRGDMLHIRADALERLGAEGIGCTVTSVEEDYGGDGLTFRRIRGTYTVPSYVDSPTPPARFVRGDDGLPVFVENVEVPFSLLVPRSLVDDGVRAGPLTTFGHGLMGNADDYLSWGTIRSIAHRAGSVLVATHWAGMSSEDTSAVAAAIVNPSDFAAVAERLQQGMVNQIALTRTFSGVCAGIPELEHEGVRFVDPERRYFVGVSQGGILGATLMALSPDVDRGALLVNGAVFPFMIERSIDFVPYLPLYASAYPDRLDQALLLSLSEYLWEHAEGSGYLASLGEGLPGVGPKEVISLAALNDAQVPNLATDWAWRTAGMPAIRGSAREPWGVEVVDAPWQGSGAFTIDWGDPVVPEGNVAPETDEGGHWYVPTSDLALGVMLTFFEEGQVVMPCDGVCDPD